MLTCFSSDYREARSAFVDAAAQAKAEHACYPHPLSGPNQERLSTDVVWLGSHDAECVLLLLSATHGVEGFCGSAAQTDMLRHLPPLPDGVAILMVHAINPHGFAWLRRVTEDGIDLNRNYVDFSQPLPVNRGYVQLADAIVPGQLDAHSLYEAEQILADYQAEHGQIDYEKALSAGQYTHPDGLFYGGIAASWSRLISERVATEYRLAERRRVALIDFHTGIGPFGYGEPICDHPPGSIGVRLARSWYGDSVTEPALGTSISVAKHGLSDYGWMAMLGESLVFIALEFGTYPFENLLRTLRADHWLHRQPCVQWHDAKTQSIKQAIRHHFYPATSDWQEMVLMRSRQCIRQALQGLQTELI